MHVHHRATKAVRFNSSVTAIIAERLSFAIQGIDSYTSAFEADPKINLIELMFNTVSGKYVLRIRNGLRFDSTREEHVAP